LNLYNLESESDSTSEVHNHPGKYERKSKWLSAKQVDRLGKVSWFMISKKKTEPPVIIGKTKKSILRLNYYFNNGFLTSMQLTKWIPLPLKSKK
jgi:hypothetical protein